MFSHLRLIFIVTLLFLTKAVFAVNVPIETFDLSKYSQDPNYYISASDKGFNNPILTTEQQNNLLKDLLKHSIGEKSPWSKSFFEEYTKSNNLSQWIDQQMHDINNNELSQNQKVYQENYRLLTTDEYKVIFDNIDLKKTNLKYQDNNRAIVTKPTISYTVPYSKPLFLEFTLPGQGYPFSNINQSSLSIGQAVYIISTSKDKRWFLILTDSFYGWVKSDSITRISDNQIEKWRALLMKSRLSIKSFDAGILSSNNKEFVTDAYPGTMLPLINQTNSDYEVLTPINLNGKLSFVEGVVKKKSAIEIPISTTPANFVKVIKNTEGFPYGWGNEYFYNDCSSEIKTIYQAFGIWLPRNSGDQGNAYTSINLDDKSADERIKLLLKKGRPFLDFIYIQGHVMIYIGKSNLEGNIVPVTYQQVWALKDKKNTKRSIIGKSVFLPLLNKYPQDTTLEGQQNNNKFRIIQIA